MAIDTRTIVDLEKDGFTHIDARCAGWAHRAKAIPHVLERKQIITATTVAELRRRYRCQTCVVPKRRFLPVAAGTQQSESRPIAWFEDAPA